ncbi:TPA: hypothetical protein HA231_01475 [Candidatus Woesearchaeota archaeon]|nr:hypothetical protein [Candidatus Woesearchaeota archaeon]
MAIVDPSSYLQQTGQALSDPLVNIWQSFVSVTPSIIAGVLVLIFGYILSSLLGALTHAILNATKVDEHLRKARLAHSIGFISLATLGGALMKWYVFAVFLVESSKLFKLGVLSEQLARLANMLPNVFAAVLFVLAGLIVADFAADRMLHAKRKGVRVASSLVRWALIIIVIVTALKQIGVDVSFISNLLLILTAAVGAGIAIALGLGFGHAFKDESKTMIKHLKKNW